MQFALTCKPRALSTLIVCENHACEWSHLSFEIALQMAILSTSGRRVQSHLLWFAESRPPDVRQASLLQGTLQKGTAFKPHHLDRARQTAEVVKHLWIRVKHEVQGNLRG